MLCRCTDVSEATVIPGLTRTLRLTLSSDLLAFMQRNLLLTDTI